MKFAQVIEVYLNEDEPKIEGLEKGTYTIQVLLKTGSSSQRVLALPLNINSKYIPVVGEYVIIEKGPSDYVSAAKSGRTKYYYSTPVSVQNNINNNILENTSELKGSGGLGFGAAAAGLSSAGASGGADKKNKEFKEVVELSQLQPYAGDIIHEGRFGQSIRFGYTPEGAKSNIKPSWTSTKSESPITIITNGRGESRGYNKFVIENINKDASSIWLTDQQTINLKLSNKVTLGVTPVSTYKSPQLILNSDRVVINSKKDSVIISGKKSVNISTKGWKADMDTMFNQLEAIVNALNSLAPQLAGAITAAGAPVPLVQTGGGQLQSAIAEIKSQLQLMKQ